MFKSISSPSPLPNGWGWSWNFHPSNHGCVFLVGSAPPEARLGPPVTSHHQHTKDTLGTREILRVWRVVCRNQAQRPNIYYLSHHSRWGWLCPRERPRVVVLGGLCCLWLTGMTTSQQVLLQGPLLLPHQAQEWPFTSQPSTNDSGVSSSLGLADPSWRF